MSEIIAKAMNSTLGTSGFKGFDEILLDSKCLVPSDEVLAYFGESSRKDINDISTGSTSEREIASFIMPLNGTIRLKYLLCSNNGDKPAYLLIYVNNSQKFSISSYREYDSELEPATVFVTAKRGDTITIKSKSTSYTSGGNTYYSFRGYLYDIEGRVVDAPSIATTLTVH